MNKKEQRQKFEKWVGGDEQRRPTKKLPPQHPFWPGHYALVEVQLAWEAWQEATK